jgi:hypothetical protein
MPEFVTPYDDVSLGTSAGKAGFHGKAVAQAAAITPLTDSTTGTASDVCNDTTASVKDDIASIIAKVNAILTALKNKGIIA